VRTLGESFGDRVCAELHRHSACVPCQRVPFPHVHLSERHWLVRVLVCARACCADISRSYGDALCTGSTAACPALPPLSMGVSCTDANPCIIACVRRGDDVCGVSECALCVQYDVRRQWSVLGRSLELSVSEGHRLVRTVRVSASTRVIAFGSTAPDICALPSCNLTSHTCVYAGTNGGTVCRASAGVCDVAEKCDGVSPACPVDVYLVSVRVRACACVSLACFV
jgi:hypothetical protein